MARGRSHSLEAPRADSDALKSFYENRYSGGYMAVQPDDHVARVRDVLSEIRAPAITSVLDYGCGRGSWTRLLHELFPGAHIDGIDISEKAVQRARDEG